MGGGGYSLIWPLRGCAGEQAMVFVLSFSKQGIQLRASLSVLNSVNDSCESIVLIINKAVVLNRVLKLRVLS